MSPVEQYTIDCECLVYFEPKKIKQNHTIFFYKRDIMHLFSADATIFKKKIKKVFFDHENIKKLLHTYGSFDFFLCSPNCPKQPRIDNSFYRLLYPMICGTISGDVST